MLGVILKNFVRIFAFYPLLLFIANLHLNMDPLYYNIESLNLSSNLQHYGCHFIRNLIVLLALFEVCRLYPFVFLVFVPGIDMFVKSSLNMIKASVNKSGRNLRDLITKYNELQLILITVSSFQECGTLFLMGIGLFLSILFNYATIKCYLVFPIYFYIFCLSVSFIIICVVDLTLPYAQLIFEQSSELLRILPTVLTETKLNSIVMSRETKCARKKLSSLQALKLYAGIGTHRFYYLQKSTKTTFYSNSIIHTINLLLCIPIELLQQVSHLM